jgi:hypothetical protein
MKRFIPLAVGALALAAFAFAQHATGFASGQNPVAQTATTIPAPVPAMTPIPTLTPIAAITPVPLTTTTPLPMATP